MEGTLEHWQYDTFRVRWDDRWQGNDLITFILGLDGGPARLEMDRRSFERIRRGG